VYLGIYNFSKRSKESPQIEIVVFIQKKHRVPKINLRMDSIELISSLTKRANNPKTIHDMAEGLSPKPKIEDKLTEVQWLEFQKFFDFALPDLLQTIYTKIGDGGFGPGYGLYSSAVIQSLYEQFTATESWQEGMLPICTWGCAIYSCIDCKDPNMPIYVCSMGNHILDDNVSYSIVDEDGNTITSGEISGIEKPKNQPVQFSLHRPSLADWLKAWVDKIDLWTEMVGEEDYEDWEDEDEENEK
jgi:hypothetical protein